jgi:hypothetical protein
MEDDAAAAAEIRRREGDRHATAESEAYMPARGRGGRGGRGGRRRVTVAALVPNLPNDLNAPKQRLRYHKILLKCMEYTHNRVYEMDKVFTK